ncbi:MAG: hypothetical protein ACYC4L_09750 [Chloroflexota bacterium]
MRRRLWQGVNRWGLPHEIEIVGADKALVAHDLILRRIVQMTAR